MPSIVSYLCVHHISHVSHVSYVSFHPAPFFLTSCTCPHCLFRRLVVAARQAYRGVLTGCQAIHDLYLTLSRRSTRHPSTSPYIYRSMRPSVSFQLVYILERYACQVKYRHLPHGSPPSFPYDVRIPRSREQIVRPASVSCETTLILQVCHFIYSTAIWICLHHYRIDCTLRVPTCSQDGRTCFGSCTMIYHHPPSNYVF